MEKFAADRLATEKTVLRPVLLSALLFVGLYGAGVK